MKALRELVDLVWLAATDGEAVPSTQWADRLIAQAGAADEMLRLGPACRLLGVSPRQLPELPIKKYDVAKVGCQRPSWRWRRGDLEAWLESRLVLPGHSRVV